LKEDLIHQFTLTDQIKEKCQKIKKIGFNQFKMARNAIKKFLTNPAKEILQNHLFIINYKDGLWPCTAILVG
jgi:hypothetical protein